MGIWNSNTHYPVLGLVLLYSAVGDPIHPPKLSGQTNSAVAQTDSDVVQDRNGVVAISLQMEYMPDEGVGLTQLFLVSDDDEVNVLGETHRILRPSHLRDKTIGYVRLYFSGRKGVLKNNTLALVNGFESNRAEFYVDHNNNLDFTDDPKANVEWNDQDHARLTLSGDEPGSRFSIRLIPFASDSKMTSETSEQFRRILKVYESNGLALADVDYWFYNQRLNTMTRGVEIDGQSVMIGLHDYDCDGLYNGDRDRLVIGARGDDHLSNRLSAGAVAARAGEIFLIEQRPYEIVEVDRKGRFVRVKSSDRMPERLFEGSPVPSIEAKTFAGEEVRLDSLCGKGKWTILDFWGHWCEPCVMAIPETVEFKDAWKADVQLIGIHSGDHDEAHRLIDAKSVDWLQLETNERLEQEFFVDGWPTYVLIGRDGNVVSFRTTLPNIVKRLQAEQEDSAENEGG
ncbi:MAG: TlpA disulfide reductase family protein [Planctomycetota bacterium]